MNQLEQFRQQQRNIFKQLNIECNIRTDNINTIAGIDLAYWKHNSDEYAVCCIVVIDYKTKKVIEKKHKIGRVAVPYIPTYLAFREMPLVYEAYTLLENQPDLLMFDGNGYLHPLHMGLATHAGIMLNKPSIGVAKTYYKIQDTDYIEPENEKGKYSNIIIDNEVYGRALRTQKNVKPVFVSIGNKMDIDTAIKVVMDMVTKESHIPLPTRLADIETHIIRKSIKI